jgi:hypothetical protein
VKPNLSLREESATLLVRLGVPAASRFGGNTGVALPFDGTLIAQVRTLDNEAFPEVIGIGGAAKISTNYFREFPLAQGIKFELE